MDDIIIFATLMDWKRKSIWNDNHIFLHESMFRRRASSCVLWNIVCAYMETTKETYSNEPTRGVGVVVLYANNYTYVITHLNQPALVASAPSQMAQAQLAILPHASPFT